MSTVPLLLAAIFLTVFFLILYLIIRNDFNENEFNNRLQIMLEFMKRTNAEFPMPDELSYVSDVDIHQYLVTTFSTQSLQIIDRQMHDDRVETFDFLKQSFTAAPIAETSRIVAHPTDDTKFRVRGDDGWIDIDCSTNKRFDVNAQECVSVPVCEGKSPGNYGLTESMIDTLILNHPVSKPNDDNAIAASVIHPTMYLRCFEGGSHAVLECPANYLFDAITSQCIIRNDCQNRPDGYALAAFPEDLKIDEYLECRQGEVVVARCPENQIFDRRAMNCVVADPCAIHGAGYTYITETIGPAQYFECLSATETQLITCVNRVFVNNRYECRGDPRCATFTEGTGTALRTYSDENVQFDSGVLICNNYEIVTDLYCDTDNILAEKVFDNKFKAGIHVPAQIYDATRGQCVPFETRLFNIKSDHFAVESMPNDLNVEYQTAMLGKTSAIEILLRENSLDGAVVYARDENVVGFDPISGEPTDCFGERALYDVFSATQLNSCSNNNLVTRTSVTPSEYIKADAPRIVVDDDYNYSCGARLDQIDNFVKMDHFTVNILTNILRYDACGTILNDLHVQYTTKVHKYTTPRRKYTYENVKSELYMGTPTANIPVNDITIEDKHRNGDDTVMPIFDPFEYVETLQPAFDPFEPRQEPKQIKDLSVMLPRPPVGPVPRPETEPEPEPELELNLTEKLVEFACFYALPTHKLSACQIVDDHIKNEIRRLRETVRVHADCTAAAGLANVINAYAYLGNGIGCRSVYDSTLNVIAVDSVRDGPIYLNVVTQSDDNARYNNYIHIKDGKFLACPPSSVNANFECDITDNVLYYLENMQI
ncbi:vp91 capsid protein [Orgyia leucostigma nucleopolyhedrovirus]|uniref:Vp91 capsid protein n=1 Tax=Orgyia leucostigma nucleopolyhedrovirus TaxID=490711 RepID=B0FDU3_9ABAC|nr:vp91 capsid protein [Orgyia leucostigma nucleopolyhedrovirus]ABY65801.1 vp91 capsid protein [Orgyia leucostigma nucleopolyhedrovirus]